ncbi:MAG: tetratricopeptide repeat protein, partial [Gammaproteobacteria bacterium]|nr:tetratricopeptide repeat protein [Gammaproteobacteria bacterium]
MRLDPNFAAPYLTALGQSQFNQQDYHQAIETLQRAVRINPRDRRSSILLISALGYQDLRQEAKLVMQRLNKQLNEDNMRHLTIDWLKNRWPYQQISDRNHFITGLKQAGVPDW